MNTIHFVPWLFGFKLVLLNRHRITSRSKERRSGVRYNEDNSNRNSYGQCFLDINYTAGRFGRRTCSHHSNRPTMLQTLNDKIDYQAMKLRQEYSEKRRDGGGEEWNGEGQRKEVEREKSRLST